MARILLAEDDDSMRDFLAKALNRAGHDVDAVADGEEGLDALGEAPGAYELLLTDIVMPGVDGIELARRASSSSGPRLGSTNARGKIASTKLAPSSVT